MRADQLTVGTDYALARRLQRNLDRATVDRVTLLEFLGGGEVRVRLADPKLRTGRDGSLVASTRALVWRRARLAPAAAGATRDRGR